MNRKVFHLYKLDKAELQQDVILEFCYCLF